jgi:hypothetical protein
MNVLIGRIIARRTSNNRARKTTVGFQIIDQMPRR